MNFSSELLFFFSALGAFNGIVLSVYIFVTAGKKHIANRFLSIALLMLSIRAGKSVFFYFDDNLAQSFIQIGIAACFFIGPFVYFYVVTVCHKDHRPPKWLIHLGVLIPIITFLTWQYPYYEYRGLWGRYLLRTIYVQWVAYLLLSAYFFYKTQQAAIFQKNLTAINRWTLHVLSVFFFVWLAYFTSGYTSYIVGAVTFTVIGYLLVLFILNTRKKSVFLLHTTSQKIDPDKSEALLLKLEDLFLAQDLYTQPSLKCAEVAQRLGVPAYQLSQTVNESTGENFNQYVNVHRIEAAKELLRTRPELTIEAVGLECGFKSKSSFYAAFKKNTGTTPSKFV